VAERLPAALEAAALVRRASAAGDFAAVLRKGDPDRGAILLIVASRGRHACCLERVLSIDGHYAWNRVGPPESASSADLAEFLARRARFDEDTWQIELDIAEAERFIAETMAAG
jgi:hypothetical protein